MAHGTITEEQSSERTLENREPVDRLRRIEDLPHPPGLPIVGNGHQLTPETLHLQLEAWADQYGCPYRTDILADRFVHFDSPQATDQVLRQRPDIFSRYHKIEALTRELHTFGVFSSEGDEWKAQRRLAMAALAQKNLKGFYSTLRLVALRLQARWHRAAAEETELDLLEEVMLFTVDVTSSLAFGRDTNTIEQPGDRIQEHLAHVFPKLQSRMIAVLPYWRYVKLPSDRRLERSLRQLDSWIAELLAEARVALARRPELLEQPENLLQAMMASERADGEPYSDEQLAGNVMTMLLAGEDTTANTIAWTVHELLEHPDVLRDLAQEVDEHLGTTSVPTEPSVLERLQLTGWAANEALRLRSVVPAMAATALRDVVVDGVSLTAGTHVTLLLRRLSTDSSYVTRPREFLPARWGDEHLGDELRLRGLYVPFGSGPRICPGRALALLELRMVLAMLLHQFSIERVGEASAVQESLSFTMAPKGLKVRLRARERP